MNLNGFCVRGRNIYLEIYVSGPFHDSVTRPHNGVTVLVLTV